MKAMFNGPASTDKQRPRSPDGTTPAWDHSQTNPPAISRWESGRGASQQDSNQPFDRICTTMKLRARH
ncbi:hypothetical protein CDL15_Pgr018475 [Punica granatum]|uniref:Uncharacterized protein n=1 Tax=Punica granatum TaxID=22663 RepID=A0A218WZE4_PUNGR|nr:hypothetical protein CDL15_Pgr018475 [Punica granatum]